MANPFYGVTGNPATQSRSASLLIRTEFGLIEAGFLSIYTTLATKDSPSFTGIPLAPTAAIGTDTDQIATMRALKLASFSASLPSQGGHGGAIISTDGVNAAWVTPTPSLVGLSNVNNTSDVNKPVSTAQANANASILASAQYYADTLVIGLWDDRGNYNASNNLFPSSFGSGQSGAVLKGDIWTISVAGVIGGVPVSTRQTIRATVDIPGQAIENWAIGLANTDLEDSITDGVTGRAPSQNAVFDALALKVTLTTLAAAAGASTVGNTPAGGIFSPTVQGALNELDSKKQFSLGFTPYNSSNPSGYTANLGTVTSVTASSPLVSTGGTTPYISMPQATASVPGYVSATDWSSFNAKQAAIGYTTVNKAGDQMSGPLIASASTGAIAQLSGNAAGMTVQSAGAGNASLIGFVRNGIYGSYLGLDIDNIWKVGGWSAGAISYSLLHTGNYTAFPAICKAWVNFNGNSSGTITPISSYNVTSITKIATGDYVINFTTPMNDANYVVAANPCSATSNDLTRTILVKGTSGSGPSSKTISSVGLVSGPTNTTGLVDVNGANVIIFGN